MTKRITRQKFIDYTNHPILANAVITQLGGWKEFKQNALDVTKYGAQNGFHDFIYYVDTIPFAQNNRPHIKALMEEQRVSSIVEFISFFNCLDLTVDEVAEAYYGNKNADWYHSVHNALAWYALEEVCRMYESFVDDLNR